jgi:hypothetical protein
MLAAAEGRDGPMNVLVDVEALAGRHRQLIEQLSNAL